MSESNRRLVAGSYSEMKTQMMILKQLQMENGNTGGFSRPLPVDAVGKIQIKLYFKGRKKAGGKLYYFERSFRLMKDNPQFISEERIKQLGAKIKEKFQKFEFTTGKTHYTYNSPDQGFNRVWGGFSSLTQAQRFFEQMLDIDSLSPEWHRLSRSDVPLPGNRFAEIPEKITTAGVAIRGGEERPVVPVKFYRAGIKFPHIDEMLFIDEFGTVYDIKAKLRSLASKD